MSKLNINRNIFLEREELLRWQSFLIESNVNQLFLANTTIWGIVDTSGGLVSQDFLVETGTSPGTVKVANLSRAITDSGLLIKQEPLDNIAVPNDSAYYWMKISHTYSKIEKGTCGITANGQVTGTNTIFTDVLRGQSTEVPVKIKFLNSSSNLGIYEVVDVVDNSNIILLGDSFTPENNLTYMVIGSTPLGDTVTSEQQNGLYFYDSCQIDMVAEAILNTEPAGKVTDSQFWIARVINNLGVVTIEDKRTEYWEYYIKGVSDKLTKTSNLSDLTEPGTARNNLDVYSRGEVDVLVGADETAWLSLSRGADLNSTDYDVKIRRIGKMVNITGKFKFQSVPAANAILLSIAYSSIGASKAAPTNRIYSQAATIETEDLNHGLKLYVAVPADPGTPAGNLEVRNSDTSYVPSSTLGTIYYINVTYLAG